LVTNGETGDTPALGAGIVCDEMAEPYKRGESILHMHTGFQTQAKRISDFTARPTSCVKTLAKVVKALFSSRRH
jgi:shikimate kinase